MRLEWLFLLPLDKSQKKNGQILDLLGFAAGKNVTNIRCYGPRPEEDAADGGAEAAGDADGARRGQHLAVPGLVGVDASEKGAARSII